MSGKQELREKAVWRSDPHTLVNHLVYRHYLDSIALSSTTSHPFLSTPPARIDSSLDRRGR